MKAVKKTPVRTEPVFKFSTEGQIVRHISPDTEIEVFRDVVVQRYGEHVPINEVWRLEVGSLHWVLESVGLFKDVYLVPLDQEESFEVQTTEIPSIFRN